MIPQIIHATVTVLSLLIIIRSLSSWFPGIIDPRGSVAEFLHTLTEPILGPIRSILPSMGGFDLSPIIAIVALQFVGNALANAL